MQVIFGGYTLRQHQRELVGPNGPIQLSGRSFDLLNALLQQPNELLDKAALFDAAWPGVIVEENTLQVHMSALRKGLGSGFIATVHGRGYKYVGPTPRLAPVSIAYKVPKKVICQDSIAASSRPSSDIAAVWTALQPAF